MPSASTTKPEKQASNEPATSESSTSTSNQQNTPLRQAVVIIEHKIRNLEKRKSKLENYRELQASGKELHQDQKVAVKKYDEVFQTLEFAKDLCKQFNNIVTVSEKEAKKQARKDASQRIQQDIAKIREVLIVQDVLQKIGDDAIREDFLYGRNGAVPISAENLELLDKLFTSISPKHASESPDGSAFNIQVQQAAEHMLALVDAKPKEFSGSTFAHIKGLIDSIHKCGYLDIIPTPVETVEPETWNRETEAVVTVQQIEESLNVGPMTEITHGQQCPVLEPEIILEHPTTVAFTPVPEVVPAIVPVVEQPYFTPQPQPRPITEMLGAGSFFFLQESELDSPPEMVVPHPLPNTAAPIPSQTFTNQNFTNVQATVPPLTAFQAQNPPPPIPMPPSHLSPQQQQPTIPPYNSEPPAASNFPPTQQFETFTISQSDVENGNANRDEDKNGSGDWAEVGEERGNGSNHGNRPRGGGGSNRNRGGYYQNNYYQNNGYGGGNYKPRGGNRSGGPRTGGGGPKGHFNRSKPPAQQH